jgi:hypothetical protein
MLIEIPYSIRKLKQKYIDILYSKYKGEDVFKNMSVYDADIFYEERKVETIGIWMSGGADSSLLAYLLAKKIKDENLDVKIQPLTVRRTRPNNPIYAGVVIDFIEEELNITMKDHIIYYPDKENNYQIEIKEFWDRDDENFSLDKFQVLYSGITRNPPADDTTIPKNKERTRDEDAERPLVSENGIRYYMNPFFDINKKGLAKLYEEYGMLNKLFPLTYSCEGSINDTNGHTKHCQKCWWCQERFWAFGRYV